MAQEQQTLSDFEKLIDCLIKSQLANGFIILNRLVIYGNLDAFQSKMQGRHAIYGNGTLWDILKLLDASDDALCTKAIDRIKKHLIDNLEKNITLFQKQVDDARANAEAILGNKPLPKNNNKRKREYEAAVGQITYPQQRLDQAQKLLKFHQELQQ